MNLRAIDLNLLVVLNALLEEAHVSRAGEKLGLSQPAMSAALERCRRLMRDPLFHRGRGVMRPTAKALALREPLKKLLGEMTALIDPPPADLRTLRRTVRLIMADLPAQLTVPPLLARLTDSAPGVDIVILPWRGAADAVDSLERDAADIAVSTFPAVTAAFRRQELFFETYVVAMRRDHPAATGFDLDRWLAFPHIMVSGRGETHSEVDDSLARLGRTRRVAAALPSFLTAAALLETTNMIALLPRSCIDAERRKNFALFPPPIATPGFPLHLARHVRSDDDPVVDHVANVIAHIADVIAAPFRSVG